MRTKEEEHKLIETFDQTTAAIKNDRPVFTELLKATEEYQKSLAQTVFCGNKVIDVMKRIVGLSPDTEMTKGLEDIADILATHEKHCEELSKNILMEILVPIRQQHDEEKKSVPEFIKRVKAQRKQSEKAVKDAEMAAGKAGKKGGADLKTKMEELSKQEQLRQQQLSEQLKEALQAQRSKYCLYVKCWSEMFNTMKAQDEEIVAKVTEASPALKKLGESANEISAAQVDLVTERKRTFINLANISSEWKKIFKDAGISKKDLRDSETAKLLLETLERAGINTSSLTGDAFSGIGDEEEEAPSTPDKPAPPPRTPPRGAPPPPPRGAPPPPPRGGGAPATPARGPGGPSYLKRDSAGGAPPAPPAPAAPAAPAAPPPPAAPGAPPPPPRAGAASPAPAGSRASLLDQIQQGTKLKSAADRPEPAKAPPASVSGADLSSLLMGAMASRRVAMKEEAKDDDDDWDDNDEWSD